MYLSSSITLPLPNPKVGQGRKANCKGRVGHDFHAQPNRVPGPYSLRTLDRHPSKTLMCCPKTKFSDLAPAEGFSLW